MCAPPSSAVTQLLLVTNDASKQLSTVLYCTPQTKSARDWGCGLNPTPKASATSPAAFMFSTYWSSPV